MATRKRFLILILIVILFSLQIAARESKPGSQDDTYQPRDYSMVSIEIVRETLNKPVKLKTVRVRLVKADGQWKEAIVGRDGRIILYWAKPDGVYLGEPDNLYLTRKFIKPPSLFHSVKFLRSHKQFVREESILGYRAFVLRNEREEGNYTEAYMSPEFGITPVKKVTRLPGVQEHVTEAVRLEFTEITDKMLNDASLLWIKTYLAQAIVAVEKQGRKELIDDLKQIQLKLQTRIKK